MRDRRGTRDDSCVSDDPLLSSLDGRVLTLTMNRPQSLNALDRNLVKALRSALEGAARDSRVGCVILTGSGRSFSAGADLKEVSARYQAGDTELGDDLRRNYSPLIRAIRACPVPVIAAINGTAAGAGLSLALACDLRLAAADAQLIVVFVRVGLVPDAGSLFFLTRLVGLGKATELALTGDPVDAAEAKRIGLVSEVVATRELLTVAHQRATRLALGPTQTYALIKRGLERAMNLDLEQTLELEAQLQSLAARTSDHKEALGAFLEKRKRPPPPPRPPRGGRSGAPGLG
jgi:2-(1,2-epoxy-1,2-dihydrophenyl)acetyl-CoA isomerase